MRFGRIVDFKKSLADKVVGTHKASLGDPNHSPFLKNFGKFHVATLTQTEVSADKVVVELLTEMRSDIEVLKRRLDDSPSRRRGLANEQTVTGIARLVAAVTKFKRKSKLPVTALVGNEQFYDAIESEIHAPQFFGSPTEFREAVNEVLFGMTARGA